MTAQAAEPVPPIYILMKPDEKGDIVFLDVRSSVPDAERQLGGCMAANRQDLPTYFLYFDDVGQPLDAVRTSEASVALRPRDEAPNRELLGNHIQQALAQMDRYLQAHPDAAELYGQRFEALRRDWSEHYTNPQHPIPPYPGPWGWCCRVIRWCCQCAGQD
jgi:hypothetical protein